MAAISKTDAHNLAEIERLNQRGGRTLSFVDLIDAGTVSVEMAGEFAAMVEAGASIITGAREGGVGKSTLLADLLVCLPAGETIITTPDAEAVRACTGAEGPACFLAHEIGSGPWYAYLWGAAAAEFIQLAAGTEGRRIATCLHADSINELYDILTAQGAPEEAVRGVDLAVIMRRGAAGRRVEEVHIAGREGHQLRWLRNAARDEFEEKGEPSVRPERADEFAALFERLRKEGKRELAEVRKAVASISAPG